MGFFKDAGDSIARYSNIFINKTEEYSRVAKITIEIKKLENEKGKIEKDMGQYVIEEISNGTSQLSSEDEKISSLVKRHTALTDEIDSKRNEIEEIKTREQNKKEDDDKAEVKSSEIKESEPAEESDKQAAE